MGWFPRAFGVLLLILAVGFILDLLWPDLDYSQLPMFREICPDCIYEERIYSEEGEVHRSSRCYPGPFNRTCPKCRAGWRKSGLLGAPNFISMSLFVFGVVGLTHARLVSCGSCGGLNRCRNLRGDPTPAFCTHCGGQGRVTIWTWATS